MAKAPAPKGGGRQAASPTRGGAKAPSPNALANLRARVKELKQDERLLRSALDRAEQQLKGKGIR